MIAIDFPPQILLFPYYYSTIRALAMHLRPTFPSSSTGFFVYALFFVITSLLQRITSLRKIANGEDLNPLAFLLDFFSCNTFSE